MSRTARAPGKVVLTGAYAVLHGAPALVAAVSRGAVANGARSAPPSREVEAARTVFRLWAIGGQEAVGEGQRKDAQRQIYEEDSPPTEAGDEGTTE